MVSSYRRSTAVTITVLVLVVLTLVAALWTKTVLHAVDQPISGKMPITLPVEIPNPKGSAWTYTAKVTTTGGAGVSLKIVDRQTKGLVQTASNADPQSTAIISAQLNPLREYDLVVSPAKGSSEATFTGTQRHTFSIKRHRLFDLFRR